VGVLDDDGDEFVAVAGAEFDALTGDHDPAGRVHLSLCAQRSGGQRWRR
jgi:hypothetical protein